LTDHLLCFSWVRYDSLSSIDWWMSNSPWRRAAISCGYRAGDSALPRGITVRDGRDSSRGRTRRSSTGGHSRKAEDHGEEIVQIGISLATLVAFERYEWRDRFIVLLHLVIVIIIIVAGIDNYRCFMRFLRMHLRSNYFRAGSNRFLGWLRNFSGQWNLFRFVMLLKT